MNGILCIDKPADYTSFDVVAKMRGIAKTRKIGHGGTLDPMATGVLPLFFGHATKAVDLAPQSQKRYTATFQLGLTTDTQDITGTVTGRFAGTANRNQVEKALERFIGELDQIPPMYSAIRKDGVRLYDLARQGVEVERQPRRIRIDDIRLLDVEEAEGQYTIDVLCSKGTYIRTLCHDLGQYLECGAVLTALRRTESAGFPLTDCITLEEAQQLADNGSLESRLLPVQTVFSELPALNLNDRLARLFQNGVRLRLEQLDVPVSGPVAVYRPDAFLGIAEPADGQLRLIRLFLREDKA